MSVRNILDGNGKIAAAYLPAFIANDLAAPVVIQAEAPATSGNPVILVDGDGTSEYGGSITLNPGSNDVAGEAQVGVNIKSTPTGCSVEVGTNGATGAGIINHLYIAGGEGLSEVNDPVYNPVQMFVDANPGQTTTNTETITPENPSNTIRVIPLGNTPPDYNYFKMYLDFNSVMTFSNADNPYVRFYISNTSNGAYVASAATTSWAQTAALASGERLIVEDVPLIYNGVPTDNQLFLNYTFAVSPPDGAIAFADPAGITTDYSIEASKVSAM